MNWINFIAASKYARGTEGHILSEDLVNRASQLESEAYHCVFDLVKEQLKIELDTGRTEVFNGKNRKIYSYHDQNSGVEGLLSFNQYAGAARPAFGVVQFDFDHAEDINISFKDAVGFIEWLGINAGVDLAFSGSKGFHVSVPFEYFGLEVSPELPKILHDLAASLSGFFKTLDVKVYNANRKFRILNTSHGKTKLYKTLVSKDWSVPEIIEYAKRRRTRWFTEIDRSNLKPLEVLVLAIQDSEKQHEYDKEKAGGQTDQTRFESYDGKICIQRLITDKCEEGGRNNTALVIAYDLFKTGKTKNYAIEVITKWANDNNLALTEALPIVDRAFSNSQYYNHGCQDSIKASKCSAKCPLWKKLDPEKRPIPVDAPKTIYLEAGKKTKLPAAHFIEEYLIRNVVTVDLSSTWFINSKQTNQAYLEDLIFVEALARKRTVDSCSKQVINSHLNVWTEKEKERLLLDLRNHIKYIGEEGELEKWLKAVKQDGDEADLSVLRHWIWQVKRKIFGLPVLNHIMPVFCGASGTGKSKAVEALIAPLRAVAADSDLKRLGESREDFSLIENYIMFLDEMAKAGSTDIETLKSKITATFIQYRKLGTNSLVKGPQNCSFIGTSNYSVVDVIKDPTSARRYYELWIKDRCDWKTINELDYLAIWRSVDETKARGYYEEVEATVKERQELIRDRDSVEEWLEYDNLKPVDGVGVKEVNSRDLYDQYIRFMEFQKRERYLVSINKFGRLMSTYTKRSRKEKTASYLIADYSKTSPQDRVERPEINF